MVQQAVFFLVQCVIVALAIGLLTEALVEWYRVLLVEPTAPPSKSQEIAQRVMMKIPLLGQAQQCGFCFPVWVSFGLSVATILVQPSLLIPAACAWPFASRVAHYWHDVQKKTEAHKLLAQREE